MTLCEAFAFGPLKLVCILTLPTSAVTQWHIALRV